MFAIAGYSSPVANGNPDEADNQAGPSGLIRCHLAVRNGRRLSPDWLDGSRLFLEGQPGVGTGQIA